ncbi:T9SS type B sorting domain-containing protein [Flavobacterium branchiicola]|uniref:T9SS type B sorting domain-containing protein n=1 Tax=Flavobacterium branchiicola TaxID=1114875 RepID=A0ABV9PJ18_9FLAO|nr:T9SS type B sorting domain-containing protein [Flavobacterium branchiicola]MBS7256769.1 T9SS type B sorting domain-containing protein [Flavobacterium branchiicola]
MVPGWKTTAPDGIIEFWKTGSNVDHVPSFAYDGEQYIELNAFYASGLYQDYDSSQTTIFNYSFAHRGRSGTDKMALKAGPPNGPFTIVTTSSTGKSQWKLYSGTYVVPINQSTTRFIFEAVETASNNPTIGNFLDAINFNSALEKPIVQDVPPVCPGNFVTLTAKSANDHEDKTIFNWYDTSKVLIHTGETFVSPPLLTDTKYSVMEITSSGCKSDFSDIEVKISSGSTEWPENDLIIQQTSAVFSDQGAMLVVRIKNNDTANFEYKIDSGNFQSSNEFYNVRSGIHLITVRDSSGCINVSREIFVIGYPLFFTPNGDGYNDRWNIHKGDNDELSISNLFIFDRYGKLLKQLNPSGEGWDGNYNGQPLPSSDYWFTVEYIDEGLSKQFRSHFSLKR